MLVYHFFSLPLLLELFIHMISAIILFFSIYRHRSSNLIWLLYIFGPGSRANLEGVNLKGAILEGSIMSGINLRVATLKNVNMMNCDLRGAVLAGADLENCNLSGSDLHEANLRGANLKDATLELMLTPLHSNSYVT